MEEVKSYNLSKKEYKKLEKSAECLYNTLIVLDYFCTNQQHYEDLYYITSIIKYLKQEADKINSFFINFDVDEED
ncbi:MAG: hypothetical protein R3Y28_04900 [Candidatus Gastranaerophilales bacterium]